jgi:hypothetical protein
VDRPSLHAQLLAAEEGRGGILQREVACCLLQLLCRFLRRLGRGSGETCRRKSQGNIFCVHEKALDSPMRLRVSLRDRGKPILVMIVIIVVQRRKRERR